MLRLTKSLLEANKKKRCTVMDIEEKTLEKIKKSISAKLNNWDSLVVNSNGFVVKFRNDNLKSIERAESFGIGLRAVENGKLGYASANDSTKINELAGMAKEAAGFGDKAAFEFPNKDTAQGVSPENRNKAVLTWSDKTAGYSPDLAIKLGRLMLDKIKQELRDMKVDIEIHKSESQNCLLNSTGLTLAEKATNHSVSIHGLLIKGESLLDIYENCSSCDLIKEPINLCDKIINKAKLAEREVIVSCGKMPVIFSPKAAYCILMAPLAGLNGKMVQKKISPIMDKVGQQITDKSFSIIDNPLLDFDTGSRIFDGDGMPSRINKFIENGILTGFAFDLQTAGLSGFQSTASANRGISGPPSPGFSTACVPNGDTSYNQMLKSVKNGILIDQSLGGGQSNLLMGEFSVNVELAYKIENGEITGRIKDAMIAGNVYDLLNKIISLSDTQEKHGNLLVPYMLFDQVSVAGRA